MKNHFYLVIYLGFFLSTILANVRSMLCSRRCIEVQNEGPKRFCTITLVTIYCAVVGESFVNSVAVA